MSAGIAGEVVFEVASGTYEEYVTLYAISGASASNRVIFRGVGADNQQVVLTSNAGYTQNSTLTLDGADYVTSSNTPCAGADEYNEIYAVGEQETVGDLSVYPNPTQGVVTIAIGEGSAFEYQVLDLAGRTVIKGKCLSPVMTLDLSGVVKGVYFISVKCDAKCLTQKVIVQ